MPTVTRTRRSPILKPRCHYVKDNSWISSRTRKNSGGGAKHRVRYVSRNGSHTFQFPKKAVLAEDRKSITIWTIEARQVVRQRETRTWGRLNLWEPDEPGNQGQVGSRALLAASAAYGILAAFALAALAAFGTLPAASETGPQLVTWFRENRDSVRWGVWALTATAPPFALVVALLRRLLPAPHRDMFLVGAVAFTVATSVWSWTRGDWRCTPTSWSRQPPVQFWTWRYFTVQS